MHGIDTMEVDIRHRYVGRHRSGGRRGGERPGWEVLSIQRDGEGDLVGAIHEHGDTTVGAIVNPGALMIAGWSLRDALASYSPPWVEVHLSNVWAREQFRHESVIAPLASGVVVDPGAFGHRLAARPCCGCPGDAT
ncbi:type II 3-dehydroquinate dehydratase [Streptomyces sp. NPDC048251]|uniref:type II 3-dehydroquinate dehydratase n=1 Tax=Streptomyces sp. NPDC048251 TaxID=3154501 RepID=UPI003448567D